MTTNSPRRSADATVKLGIVGARGHVGSELIRLIAGHPRFELAFVSSRERAGQLLADHEAGDHGDLRYRNMTPGDVARQGAHAIVLALPNGMAKEYVAALDEVLADFAEHDLVKHDLVERDPVEPDPIEHGPDASGPVIRDPVVVDLSADYRYAEGWYYGLPELTRAQAAGRRRIANPGCYATAMQLAIAPVRELLDGPVQCFGVSGYSGAGTTPSDKNDPDALRDNLIPYALIGHVHEREVARRLDKVIEFMPHVAPHFRGLTITANMHLSRPLSLAAVEQRYRDRYADEPLVRVLDSVPWVSRIAGKHHAEIGGLSLSADGRRLVVVATLDNLLKGAATQALQNLNRAFGFEETTGIPLQGDVP